MQKNSSLGKGLAELLGETNFDFINNTNKEESNIDKIEISLIDFSKNINLEKLLINQQLMN